MLMNKLSAFCNFGLYEKRCFHGVDDSFNAIGFLNWAVRLRSQTCKTAARLAELQLAEVQLIEPK